MAGTVAVRAGQRNLVKDGGNARILEPEGIFAGI